MLYQWVNIALGRTDAHMDSVSDAITPWAASQLKKSLGAKTFTDGAPKNKIRSSIEYDEKKSLCTQPVLV